MKYLIKLLSYLKYTLIPPLGGLLLWFSLRLSQGLLQYMIEFINSNQFIDTQTIISEDPQTGAQTVQTVSQWLTQYSYDFVSFVLKLAYYLDKWINVQFVISWFAFIIITALLFVTARLVLKIITIGQF